MTTGQTINSAIGLYETTGANATTWARLLYDRETVKGGPRSVSPTIAAVVRRVYPESEYRRDCR